METVIENRYGAIVLIKIKNTESFQGLLNRLKYSELKVYTYSDKAESESFIQVKLNNPELEDDELLIIIDEKFSACLFWNETTSEVFGLCDGFCSLNPYDSRQIIDHLQTISFNDELNVDLSQIKQDRRRNENFTMILRKLIASLESRQRDLICANTELKELYNKTLQTEKLAAIGQLCSTIAHELRNPLSSIDLYAKIISKNIEKINSDIKEDKIAESLNNAATCISNASKNLESLLTELIDYSKPMTIEKSDTNLESALDELTNLVKPSFEEKEVKLSLKYSLNKGIQVKFDKIKLNQAILNIIKNALEISKKDTNVEILVDNQDNDDMVHIKIQDQGEGISPENKEKIFTPYFSTKERGTGLGLAQARKIMEAHGGSLNIISTSPNGTIFGLTLPIQ
ncbi:MAG: hypothetical protein A2287_00475 [Candidatus Melainabacteria bacterium RIFOXYA12_FULL_32_12]|nr:MAG: hypothetical protein A2255_03285 [Candidatus Melainabacteria bacterium RIFOXYA2_FULL_32_9]OGI31370.1 MAG: hypothetical protein A2287_00475 [Candidatus Melainabacteria bacterium RIFOXYA12_FULL_32_12]